MNEILIKPNEWQYKDESSNLLFAWYSKPFLDVLSTWNVSEKKVLELGSGSSTLWWANKCKSLVSIEDSQEWYDIVLDGLKEKNFLKNTTYIKANNIIEYLSPLKNNDKYDIIIVDGSYREECLQSINVSNLNLGGIVILDNFEYMPRVMEMPLFRSNILKVYPQPHHFMWRTAYWEIQNFEILTDNHELNSYNQKIRRNML